MMDFSRVTLLILAFLFSPGFVVAATYAGRSTFNPKVNTHSPDTDLEFGDDVNTCWGDGPLYCLRYVSASSRFELWSDDVGATAGQLVWAKDNEPYIYIGLAAQAVRFDPSTDNHLKLTDESGSANFVLEVDQYYGDAFTL